MSFDGHGTANSRISFLAPPRSKSHRRQHHRKLRTGEMRGPEHHVPVLAQRRAAAALRFPGTPSHVQRRPPRLPRQGVHAGPVPRPRHILRQQLARGVRRGVQLRRRRDVQHP